MFSKTERVQTFSKTERVHTLTLGLFNPSEYQGLIRLFHLPSNPMTEYNRGKSRCPLCTLKSSENRKQKHPQFLSHNKPTT